MNAKKQTDLEKALSEGMVTIAVVSNREGVRLPEAQRRDPITKLNLSYAFQVRLDVDHKGIGSDLSFGGTNYPVFVPWEALMAFRDKHGNAFLYPESFATDEDVAACENPKPYPKKGGHLRLV